jgi:hypothetical protein
VGRPLLVADTSVLLNLAGPVIDREFDVPDRSDPLKNVLVRYDVHVPDTVLGELTETATGDDFLAASAELVLEVGDHLTRHSTDESREIAGGVDPALLPGEDAGERLRTVLDSDYGLDAGELDAIALAHALDADLLATDEIGTDNLPTVVILLGDDIGLASTPQLVGLLAWIDAIEPAFAAELLGYHRDRNGLSRGYIELIGDRYLG